MSAACAPASALQCEARILEHEPLARETFRLRLEAPEIAAAIAPGQFLMVRPSRGPDPLLGRPFALYDVARDARGSPVAIDIVYLILGRGTALLATRHVGETLPIWGPLGGSFGPPPTNAGPIVFVAGGIGQTPFLALGRWWRGDASYGGVESPRNPRREVILYYGARTAAYLAGLADFQAAGIEVRITTDDGSRGARGFVTQQLASDLDSGLRPAKIIGCGPPPMLAALTRIVQQRGISCDLSLENHMACGFGACFSCVAPIRAPDGRIDLKRVCVEGPVFPAATVVFD